MPKYACPICGATENLSVTATIDLPLDYDSSGEVTLIPSLDQGLPIMVDHSEMSCECGHTSTAQAFECDDRPDQFFVIYTLRSTLTTKEKDVSGVFNQSFSNRADAESYAKTIPENVNPRVVVVVN